MPAPDEKDHWLVRPSTIRLLWVVFIVILALTLVPNLIVAPYAEFGIDGTFGFFAWYGFVACVIMVFGAKALGVFLKRKDTYYDS